MPTSTTARSTCRRPDSMAGELPRHHLGARCSLHSISIPKDSDTGSRKDAYLLLEKDMEGHEREEAEVSRHGNVTVILHTETNQKSSHGPLWGDGPALALHSSPALGRWARPSPQHLEFLQLVVETPEVLGKELRTDGLPIDADPFTHLHQVGRAAERPGVIGTPARASGPSLP